MEDLQFDLMIGKVTAEEAQKGLQAIAYPQADSEEIKMITEHRIQNNQELLNKSKRLLTIHVQHKNQAVDGDGHLKRYFHEGLKRPVPSKPKPIAPPKREERVINPVVQ